MKIITNDAVYVQKNDLGFLSQSDVLIPASIFLEVFGKGVTIIDNNNRFDFVKFEDEVEIAFFKNLDWILDYDLVKDLSDSQIIKMYDAVLKEKREIAAKYNAMNKVERRKNQCMVSRCEKLDFKLSSLRDALWFKQGHIQFDLPNGLVSGNEEKNVNEKGIKKTLRKRL